MESASSCQLVGSPEKDRTSGVSEDRENHEPGNKTNIFPAGETASKLAPPVTEGSEYAKPNKVLPPPSADGNKFLAAENSEDEKSNSISVHERDGGSQAENAERGSHDCASSSEVDPNALTLPKGAKLMPKAGELLKCSAKIQNSGSPALSRTRVKRICNSSKKAPLPSNRPSESRSAKLPFRYRAVNTKSFTKPTRLSFEGAAFVAQEKPAVCEKCKELETRVLNLEQDTQEWEKRHNNIQAEGKRLYTAYEVKCIQHREMEQELGKYQDGVKILNSERDEAIEKYEKTFEIFLKASTRLQQLESENEELARKVQKMEEQSSESPGSASSEVMGENIRLKEKISRLEQLLKQKEEALEAKCSPQEAASGSDGNEEEFLLTMNSAREAANLRQALAEVRNASEETKDQLEKLAKEAQVARAEAENLRRENTDMKNCLCVTKEENEKLLRQVDDLRREIGEIQPLNLATEETYKHKYAAAVSEANSLRHAAVCSFETARAVHRTSDIQNKVTNQLIVSKNKLKLAVAKVVEQSRRNIKLLQDVKDANKRCANIKKAHKHELDVLRKSMAAEFSAKQQKLQVELEKTIVRHKDEKKSLEEAMTMMESEKSTEAEFLEEEYKCAVSTLEDKLKNAGVAHREAQTELQQTIEEFEKQITTLNGEKAELETKVIELSEKLEEATGRIQSTQNELKVRNEQLCIEKQQSEDKDAKIVQLLEVKSVYENTKEKMSEKLQEMENLREAEERSRTILMKGFENQIEELQATLKEQDSKLSEQLTLKTSEIEHLHGLLSSSKASNMELQQSCEELKEKAKALDFAREKVRTLEIEVMRANETVSTVVSSRDLLESDSAKRMMTIKDLEKRVKELEAKNSSLEGINSALKMDAGRAKDMLEVSKVTNFKLQRDAQRQHIQLQKEIKILNEQIHAFGKKTQNDKEQEQLEAKLKAAKDNTIKLSASLSEYKLRLGKIEEKFQKEVETRKRLETGGKRLMDIAADCNNTTQIAVKHLGGLHKVLHKHVRNYSSSQVAEFFNKPDIQTIMNQTLKFLEDRRRQIEAKRSKRH